MIKSTLTPNLKSLFVLALVSFLHLGTNTVANAGKYNRSAFYPAKASVKIVAQAQNIKKKDKHGMPTYIDRYRTRYVRTTAYSCAENENGGIYGNKNCLGGRLKYGKQIRSAAADWSIYPVGTKFKIKGLPYTYIVEDYGSALVGTNTVDIYHPNLRTMKRWGTRKVELTVVQWGDYERSLKILRKVKRYRHCRKMYNNLSYRMRTETLAKNENPNARAGRR